MLDLKPREKALGNAALQRPGIQEDVKERLWQRGDFKNLLKEVSVLICVIPGYSHERLIV